jgi:iron complex outermembrane receptor protein
MLAQGSVAKGPTLSGFLRSAPAIAFARKKMASPLKPFLRLRPIAALLCALPLVAVAQQTALPRVVVEGQAETPAREQADVGDLPGGTLGTAPQSIVVIDREQLRDSGAKSLSTAIRSSASVSDFYNTLYVENLQVRGFLLDNILNFRRDGLPISNYMPIAFENKERVEVLNGVSGVIAGTSSPGGLVNYALKRPTPAPLAELFFEVAERGTVTAAADIGGRSGDGTLGYRVNAAAQERRPYARSADGDKLFGSAFVDLRLAGGWLIEGDLELQRVRQISVPGFGLLDSDGDGVAETLPPPLDPRINLNHQPWTQPVETNSAIATLGASKQFDERTRVGVRALLQRIRTDDRIAFPDGCSSGPNYVYPGLCGNYDVDIYDFRSENERRGVYALDATAEHALDTSFGRHLLKGGFRQTRYYEHLEPLQTYNFAGTINALAPTDLPPAPDPLTPNTNRDLRLREAYVYDAAQFGSHWRAWLGVRRSRLDRSSVLSDGTQAVSLSQSFTTPWGALGWQSGGTFVYASAGSGVEIEAVPNRPDLFTNPGAVLPALRSRQAEIGAKHSYSHGALATLALFEIEKPSADDVPQDNGLVERVADLKKARHRGLEASYTGRLGESLIAGLSLAWIDAEITRAADPALVGKHPTNVAPFAAALRTAWRLPTSLALTLHNNFSYAGRKAVNRDNSVELPSYWQWDALLTLTAGPRDAYVVRLGVDNVTDRRYWREAPTQYWGGTYLFPAQPRTFRLSIATVL